jgi:hypothetical protein
VAIGARTPVHSAGEKEHTTRYVEWNGKNSKGPLTKAERSQRAQSTRSHQRCLLVVVTVEPEGNTESKLSQFAAHFSHNQGSTHAKAVVWSSLQNAQINGYDGTNSV